MSEDFYQQQILPYASMIAKICRAYTHTEADYEDYYQEVCLQIWQSRKAFKAKAKWSTWIYRITINVCLTLDRKNSKRFDTYEVEKSLYTEWGNQLEENTHRLFHAIKQLGEIDRAIILLSLEGNGNQEISEVMNITANNVGVRINRIKQKLKKTLNHE